MGIVRYLISSRFCAWINCPHSLQCQVASLSLLLSHNHAHSLSISLSQCIYLSLSPPSLSYSHSHSVSHVLTNSLFFILSFLSLPLSLPPFFFFLSVIFYTHFYTHKPRNLRSHSALIQVLKVSNSIINYERCFESCISLKVVLECKITSS
jgi:hypothetical protein